ncbi:MAG: CPBP family intramembrane glutamic endopeptidase [Hyphomicrobiaceae bacterium]
MSTTTESREGALAAGGSLQRDAATLHPRVARRAWLIAELGLFYIGAPLAISWAIFSHGVPLVVALQPILIAFVVYLLWDDSFLLRRELATGFSFKTLLWLLLTFLILGAGITVATYLVFPERFLALPRYRPDLWHMIMLGYPIASVIPQELVYRTFFFHRYGPLFGDMRWLAIAVNGLLFGFAHIIFQNWIAVAGTTVVGWLIAYRYETSRSFWAAWLEHALFGCLVFTVGLGGFFFTGVANLR